MATRRRSPEPINDFARRATLRGGSIPASPLRIDYYIAGLRQGAGLQQSSRTTERAPADAWKAIALLSLFVSAVALIVAMVAVVVAANS